MQAHQEKRFDPPIQALIEKHGGPRESRKKIPDRKVAKLIRTFAKELMEVLEVSEGVRSAVARKLEDQCAPYESNPRCNGYEASSSSRSLEEVRREILVPTLEYVLKVLAEHDSSGRSSIPAINPLTVTYDLNRLGD